MKKSIVILFACAALCSCRKEMQQAPGASETSYSIASATPATYWNDIFTRYEKGEWTGGDVAYSHLLPDGRSFWLFGDSFVDSVYPDRHRNAGPFIHNTIVLTDSAGGFQTLYGGTENNPKPFFDTIDPIEVWPNCAFINAAQTKIYVLMVTIKANGGGIFGFEVVGNTVAEMSLPDLTVLRRFSFGNSGGIVDWSSAALEDGDYVYIYGAESTSNNKYMHLCRTSRSNPFASVEYFDGSLWVADETKSARMQGGVSEQYSVFKYNGKYYLLTQRGVLLSDEIFIYDAASPSGPFTNKRRIYKTPQDGGNIITYNATAHTEFIPNGQLLVGYCTNSINGKDIYKNADNYRPYFVWIKNWQ